MKQLIAAVALLTACATPRLTSDIQPGDAEAAIRSADATFAQNLRARNIDRLVDDFYASDAIVMPPNAPAFRGRDSIKQLFTQFTAAGPLDLTLTTDDVIQCEDMATEIGHYDLVSAGNHEAGKYVVTWRKIDGKWRAIADIFNANAPAR